MEKIEVTIMPDGSTVIETSGFKGKACQQATAALEKAFGGRTEETLKPEYHQAGINQQQQATQS